MNWMALIRRHVDDELWSMIALDYFYVERRNDGPVNFITSLLDALRPRPDQVVVFHRSLLLLSLTLLEGSPRAAVEVCIDFVSNYRVSAIELRAIISAYTPFGLEADASRLLEAKGFAVSDHAHNSRTEEVAVPRIDDIRPIVLERLAKFATGERIVAQPGEYIAAFQESGRRKAEEFIKAAKAYDVSLDSVAVVSIGGADGAEVLEILRQSAARYGVLLEGDHAACENARAAAKSLASAGKTLTVIEGEISFGATQAMPLLEKLRNAGSIVGVAYSVNATLHELPTRSPNFSLETFLHGLVANWSDIYCRLREPCAPDTWPPLIRLRSSQIENEMLAAVARNVAAWLKIGDPANVQVRADGVEMPARLAVESLFKIFYIEDFAYEMQESVTSFSPADFERAFGREFGFADIDTKRSASGSFSKLWRDLDLHAVDVNGAEQVKPSPFIEINAVRRSRTTR